MNTRTKLFIGLICLLSACDQKTRNETTNQSNSAQIEELNLFDELIGLWANEDGKSFERWTKSPDGSYLSIGFQFNNQDTIYTEHVHVHLQNGQWVSDNTVPDQNDGKAITFKVSTLTQDEVNFGNPSHDFPTDIHYRLANKNNLHVYIAGPNQMGGRDTIPFNMSRVMP